MTRISVSSRSLRNLGQMDRILERMGGSVFQLVSLLDDVPSSLRGPNSFKFTRSAGFRGSLDFHAFNSGTSHDLNLGHPAEIAQMPCFTKPRQAMAHGSGKSD